MKILNLHFSLLLLLLMMNCSSKEVNKEIDIRLHDIWALESIDGVPYKRGKTDNSHPVIEIYVKEKRVHGTTSCNTLNCIVEIIGSNISFSDIITTEMTCPGDLENRFLSALKSVSEYKIEKLNLFLFEGEVERLVFRKID